MFLLPAAPLHQTLAQQWTWQRDRRGNTVVHIIEGDAGWWLPAAAKCSGAGIAITNPNHRMRWYAMYLVYLMCYVNP